jgi:hypothetical protein
MKAGDVEDVVLKASGGKLRDRVNKLLQAVGDRTDESAAIIGANLPSLKL